MDKKISNAVFNLEVSLDKLSALYSLFAAEYIDTSEPDNKARVESRGAIGCILFDLISEAQGYAASLRALVAESQKGVKRDE